MWEERLVRSLANARIAVIGDIMVDHFVFGAVSRISPEAPVPVLHVAEERHVPGGAANVALNAAELGAKVLLAGVIGDDPMGAMLLDMLSRKEGIEPFIRRLNDRPTIAKTRYLGGQQQIVRVDREDLGPLGRACVEGLIADLDVVIGDSDVIVLSDYGKGVLCDAVLAAVVERAAAAGKPIIVDPKRMRLADYRGASIITPNRKELEAATGIKCDDDEGCAEAAAVGIAESGAAILLTRSEKGMSLYRAGEEPVHLSAEAREVFDVSGAGDTVVATLAACLSAGAAIETAIGVANAAAGVVVGKLGTATCSPDELLEAMLRRSRRPPPRLSLDPQALAPVPRGVLAERRKEWREAGFVVGFANGCFDLLHPGHVMLLRQAASRCDRLIVAINSDASVKRLKGESRPVQTEAARAAVLAAIQGVDAVTVFDEDTPLALIELLLPDLLFKGSDYTVDQVVGGDVVMAAGGEVALIDLVAGHSTTNIVARMRADGG